MILGVDEVGRGPWAGPLVVGAVVLPDGLELDGLTDSKKLSAKRRQALDVIIRDKAAGFGLGWVHASELDEIGLAEALRVATIRAVQGVKAPYHEIIIDGTINFLKDTTKGGYVTTLPKADALIPAVSAASIIAKVARDEYMAQQAIEYPEYGFDSHVGYGTAAHQKALTMHGVTPLHRASFAPIKKLLGENILNPNANNSKNKLAVRTSTKVRGNEAEQLVANYLSEDGYEIIEQNWKTKWCEVDIIAKKSDVVYFVEVKYRASSTQGGGVDAITPKKLQQMKFAAELYGSRHAPNQTLQLIVAAVNASNHIELFKVE